MTLGASSTHAASARGAVLVTGAGSGIGEATALRLASLGFQVFAGARDERQRESIERRHGERVAPIVLDVTDAESISSASAAIQREVGSGGLAGLVNNAGVAVAGPLEALPIPELRRQLEVNVIGQVAVTQALLGAIRTGHGRIVNIGSVLGRVALPFVGAYCASKFAVEALADALRVELQPWGIAVSLIEPGKVATQIWQSATADRFRIEREIAPGLRELYGIPEPAEMIPDVNLGRGFLPPERVARAVEHALTARRPRPRYVVGADAHLLLGLTRLLSDRARDRLLGRIVRHFRKASHAGNRGNVLSQVSR